jgi:iron complex transport system substrate-binding protein
MKGSILARVASAMRIVSLIASSTEMVVALGFGDDLVGRSHECDHPPWIARLPVVTTPKFQTDGTSYEIDQRVRAIVAEGLSVYRVDAAALDRLAPDVIVTQTQCAVCAVSLADVEAALCQLVASRPRIVSLEPNRLDDVWADLQRLAGALGAPERGVALTAELAGRMAAHAARLAGRPRPRVATIEWAAPLMAGGNWMPELVAMAGGENLFGEAGGHSPTLAWEALRAADPDVIVVAPCGYDLSRTRADVPHLRALPGWDGLRARVALADGNAFFNRPGPRLVESLEILVEILHGEDLGHRASWEWVA